MKLLSKDIEELTIDDLREIIKIEEYEMLDFKEDVSTKRHIYEDVCAFANTAGGYVILGIKDKPRELAGIENPEDTIKDPYVLEFLGILSVRRSGVGGIP